MSEFLKVPTQKGSQDFLSLRTLGGQVRCLSGCLRTLLFSPVTFVVASCSSPAERLSFLQDTMKLPSSAIASAAALFILVSPVIAHGSHSNKRHANYLKRMSNVVNAKEPRQLVATGGGSSSASHTTSQSHSSASATATPPPPPPAAPTTLDGNAIPPLSQITSGMPTQGTVPLSETFAVSVPLSVLGKTTYPSP
jgi:hypothetical protein